MWGVLWGAVRLRGPMGSHRAEREPGGRGASALGHLEGP